MSADEVRKAIAQRMEAMGVHVFPPVPHGIPGPPQVTVSSEDHPEVPPFTLYQHPDGGFAEQPYEPRTITITVKVQHSPDGGWTDIHPDGSTTHVPADSVELTDDEDEDDEGTVLGAYLSTGEVLYGEAAQRDYDRRRET